MTQGITHPKRPVPIRITLTESRTVKTIARVRMVRIVIGAETKAAEITISVTTRIAMDRIGTTVTVRNRIF